MAILGERFDYIFKKYGLPNKHIALTDEEFGSLPNEFPDFMRGFYKEYGRTTMRNGLVQVCHPDDLRGILALIFGADKDFSHKDCYAYAYTAFGHIYFWNKNRGGGRVHVLTGALIQSGLTASIPKGAILENDFYLPLSVSDDVYDHLDHQGKPLFKRAVKKCGPLEIGECYGFVPALALGGVEDIDHLTRQKSAAAHLAFVAQTMDFNLIDVQGYGKSVIVRPIG